MNPLKRLVFQVCIMCVGCASRLTVLSSHVDKPPARCRQWLRRKLLLLHFLQWAPD